MFKLKILNFIDNIIGFIGNRLHGYNCNRNQFGVDKNALVVKSTKLS
jgi:hypothetical protein